MKVRTRPADRRRATRESARGERAQTTFDAGAGTVLRKVLVFCRRSEALRRFPVMAELHAFCLETRDHARDQIARFRRRSVEIPRHVVPEQTFVGVTLELEE